MKKLSTFAASIVLLAPIFVMAQGFGPVTNFIGGFTEFLNRTIVPFIFALAFIVFIWGVFKTFILGGSDSEKQKEGKQLMFYAIVGFVIMVSVWGIVNLISGSLGLGGQQIHQVPVAPGPR